MLAALKFVSTVDKNSRENQAEAARRVLETKYTEAICKEALNPLSCKETVMQHRGLCLNSVALGQDAFELCLVNATGAKGV